MQFLYRYAFVSIECVYLRYEVIIILPLIASNFGQWIKKDSKSFKNDKTQDKAELYNGDFRTG